MKTLPKGQRGFMAKRTYDILIRNAVAIVQNPDPFPEFNILRSTARDLTLDEVKDVVTLPLFDQSSDVLLADLVQLKNKLQKELTRTVFMRTCYKLFGMNFKYTRLSSSELKSKLIS